MRQQRKGRGRGPCQDSPEVVLAVLHRGTAWFICHLWDSNVDIRSSGVTARSSSSSSTTVLLSLCSSKEQLGHHSRSCQWGTHSTTMKGWALRQGIPPTKAGKLTSYSCSYGYPVEEPAEWSSVALWPRQLHHGRGSSCGYVLPQ
jgi:hypothetical protein